MVKVSICIPTYKNLEFLKRCLNSILIQTYQDFEIIITDDSPDNAIEEYILSLKLSSIFYHKNQSPLGSPENWNKAISMAQGKYIKIMHHDDWFISPNALKIFVESLENNPNAKFVFAGCIDKSPSFSKNRIIKRKDIDEIKKSPDYLFRGNYIGPPSVIFFRNGLNIYFDPDLIWLVDIEFYIRFLNQYPEFVYIPDYLVYIGISDFQITNMCVNNKTLKIQETIYLFHKLFSHPQLKDKVNLYKHFARENIFTVQKQKELGIKKTICISNMAKCFIMGYSLYYHSRKSLRAIIYPTKK